MASSKISISFSTSLVYSMISSIVSFKTIDFIFSVIYFNHNCHLLIICHGKKKKYWYQPKFPYWCPLGVFSDQESRIDCWYLNESRSCMLTFYALFNHLTVRGFGFLSWMDGWSGRAVFLASLATIPGFWLTKTLMPH